LLRLEKNGYVESFNARLRDELLDGEIFYTLAEVKDVIENWGHHYNSVRPQPPWVQAALSGGRYARCCVATDPTPDASGHHAILGPRRVPN
jgi:transposase InsO family protein